MYSLTLVRTLVSTCIKPIGEFMSKLLLSEVPNGVSNTVTNTNFGKIEKELNDNVLKRRTEVGEDNTVHTDIDMNSNRIYNLPEPRLEHEPARLKEVKRVLDAIPLVQDIDNNVRRAENAANKASASESSAKSSELAAKKSSEDAAQSAKEAAEIAFGELPHNQLVERNAPNAHDASAISFKQSGEGAVENNVQNKLMEWVHVRDFGVVGDGTDETEKLRLAHNKANVLGVPVSYNGINKVTVQADSRIWVNTDVDFSGVVFSILGGFVTNPSVVNRQYVFEVYDPDTPLETIEPGTSPDLRAGSFTPLGNIPQGFALLTADFKIVNRARTGFVDYQQSFQVGEGGVVLHPLSANLTSNNIVEILHRANPRQKITLKNATLDGGGYNNLVFTNLSRNHISLEDMSVSSQVIPATVETCRLFQIDHASDIEINRLTAAGRKQPAGVFDGTYILSITSVANLRLNNCYIAGGRPGFGSNNVNGLYVNNSMLNRVDVHSSGHNIYVDKSTLLDRGIMIGWGGGDIKATDSTVFNSAMVTDRPDYSGSWFNANVEVVRCSASAPNFRVYSFVRLESFGSTSVVPEVGNPLAPTVLPLSITVDDCVLKGPFNQTNDQVVMGVTITVAEGTEVIAPKFVKISNLKQEGGYHLLGNKIPLADMSPNDIGVTVVDIEGCVSHGRAVTGPTEAGILLDLGDKENSSLRAFVYLANCKGVYVRSSIQQSGRFKFTDCEIRRVEMLAPSGRTPAVEYNNCLFQSPILRGGESYAPVCGTGISGHYPTVFNNCRINANQYDLSLATVFTGTIIRSGLSPLLPADVTPDDVFFGWKRNVFA